LQEQLLHTLHHNSTNLEEHFLHSLHQLLRLAISSGSVETVKTENVGTVRRESNIGSVKTVNEGSGRRENGGLLSNSGLVI
jgi:hypothetical protein